MGLLHDATHGGFHLRGKRQPARRSGHVQVNVPYVRGEHRDRQASSLHSCPCPCPDSTDTGLLKSYGTACALAGLDIEVTAGWP